MRMKLVAIFVVLVGVGAAYLAGYVSEHDLRVAADARVAAADEQVAALEERVIVAEARVRGGALLGRVLTIEEAVQRRNYGQALALSSPWFDAVRAEALAAPSGPWQDALNGILARRDPVTAALATSEPTSRESLRDLELRLRRALGYPIVQELTVQELTPTP